MKSLNKKASIFVYLLILINISLIIGYIVLNNSFIADNSLVFSQRNQELNNEIFKKGKINIELSKFYNSNGGGFNDFFSCPDNLSFSGTTMSGSNISSTFNNINGDFYCDFNYSGIDGSLFYDKNISDFSFAEFDGVTTNLLNDFFVDEQKISSSLISIDNSITTNSIDSSFNSGNSIDGNSNTSYISQKIQKPSIGFVFSSPINLSKIVINKQNFDNSDFWNNAKIIYEFTDGSTVDSTISGISTRDNIEINFGHANFANPGQISRIIIESLGTDESININEIEFFEWQNSSGELWYSDGNLGDGDESLLEFDSSGLGGGNGVDIDFNSDNYSSTSSGTINYPDDYFDDDNLARLFVSGNINSDFDGFYNIFWNNSQTNDFIDSNPNNDYNPSFFIKSGEVTDGKLFLDIFSDENNLDYELKIVEFDKSYFDSSSSLITTNIYSSSNLQDNSGYIQLNGGDLSLNNSTTGNEFSFDFENKDYAIFVKNNGEKSLSYKINGEENITGKQIYLNPIDDSKNYYIETYVNHILESQDGNYFGENDIIIGKK